jgi:hypothetical protein
VAAARLHRKDGDELRATPRGQGQAASVRVDATDDPELAAILAHNRDEEKEHAAMTLEWLRRNDPVLDKHLRTYLFTTGSVLAIEHEAEHGGDSGDGEDDDTTSEGSLAIGDLKGEA